MGTPPIIGITTYARELRDDGVHPLDNFRLPTGYVDRVIQAGGMPILLPPARLDVERTLTLVDGLLLTGGGDVNPSLYGAAKHPAIMFLDDDRDTQEIALVRAAVDAGTPLLAICRGIQVLNVALGGDLYQHLPDEIESEIDHAGFPSPPQPHAVELEPDSFLAAELGETTFEVSSWHHQAVATIGDGLAVVGRAPDGVVEAIELPGHPWCVGVQWHPELDGGTVPVHQRLFNRFVAAAGDDS